MQGEICDRSCREGTKLENTEDRSRLSIRQLLFFYLYEMKNTYRSCQYLSEIAGMYIQGSNKKRHYVNKQP